ncbi:hypothetical protein EJB05_13817, partial [Eragrostis curvula]
MGSANNMKFPIGTEFRFRSLAFVADGDGDLQQLDSPVAQEAHLAELVASINFAEDDVPRAEVTTSREARMPFGLRNSATTPSGHFSIDLKSGRVTDLFEDSDERYIVRDIVLYRIFRTPGTKIK